MLIVIEMSIIEITIVNLSSNGASLLHFLQALRTKLNLILINLILSDLFIIFIGIPIDAVGAFTMGKVLDETLCSCVAFTHTLFGTTYKMKLFRNLLSEKMLGKIIFNLCLLLLFHSNRFRYEFIVHFNDGGGYSM